MPCFPLIAEVVALIACTNKDWWHVRRSVRGSRKEGFAPANRLRILQAPVVRQKSSKKDAIRAVKREVTRGLTIRRNPSGLSSLVAFGSVGDGMIFYRE